MKTNPIRILYLDDNTHDRDLVRDALQQEPGAHELIEVDSASEFDVLIGSQSIDLVLCELNVPGLTSQDVLEKVHALDADLPVIILTGSQSGQEATFSIQRGAADHIIKSPASLGILSHKIRLILGRNQVDEKRRVSERRYNDMIKRIPVGLYIYRVRPDGEAKFEYVSPRFCELLCLNEAEILSDAKKADDAVHPEDLERLIQVSNKVAETRQPFSWEGRFIVAGQQRWIRLEAKPMFLPDGDIVSNGVVMDITGRKRMEEQIMQNEAIFTSFLENSPVYVFFKDKEIRTLRLSNNYEHMLGMPVSQALGKNMDELFPSELAKSMVADDKRIFNEGKRVDVVEEFNGRIYETTKFPIFRDGKPEMLAGFTLDVTERLQAERSLRKSEAFNQAIITQSPIGIAIFSRTGGILSGNAAWKAIWGFTEEEYREEQQREFSELDFEDWDEYLQGEQDKVRQVYAKGGSLYLPDLKVPHPHPGGAKWVSQYYYAIMDEQDQVERMVTLTEDISASKEAEAELIKSRALLERVQEVAQLGSMEIDLAAGTVVASGQARSIYGWGDDVLSLANVQASALPEYRSEVDAALEALIHLRQEFNVQYKIKRKSDGAIRDIHAIAEYNSADNTVISSIQDITERKLIMQVLMENEEKFRTLFENANDMIVVFDANERIMDANKHTCVLLGYNRDELLKMKLMDLQAEEVRGSDGTTTKGRFKNYGSNAYSSIALHKNGTGIPVEITISRITIASGIRYIAIVRDVRERTRREQE